MTSFPGLRNRLAAFCAALALAGCVALPTGTLDDAQVTSEAAQAQHDLYFRPGTPALLPGEADRMNGFLRSLLLRPQDDVILTFGTTGSDVLDARRIAEVRKVIASGPARLRIVRPLGFARAPEQPDIVLVQVNRYDQVLVTCPMNGPAAADAAFNPQLRGFGCSNAVNITRMAADKRDLTAPRRLEGSDAIPSVAAVQRYRVGDVTVAPLGSTTN